MVIVMRKLIILCLLVFTPSAQADYLVKDATGLTIPMRAGTTSGSVNLPFSAPVDTSGNPFTSTNPLFVGPSAIPATMLFDRGGTIVTAGTAVQAMAVNTIRKYGWIQADPANIGTLFISFIGTATIIRGAGNQCVLPPGATCSLKGN